MRPSPWLCLLALSALLGLTTPSLADVGDFDRDGVPDSIDLCPLEPGPPENDGCPSDRDGDGIPDPEDICPDDPDHDPVGNPCDPDEDDDGFDDYSDRCPLEAGPDLGCPARGCSF